MLRFNLTEQGHEERQLLVKMKDDKADAPHNLINTKRELVLDGRTLVEVKVEEKNSAEI